MRGCGEKKEKSLLYSVTTDEIFSCCKNFKEYSRLRIHHPQDRRQPLQLHNHLTFLCGNDELFTKSVVIKIPSGFTSVSSQIRWRLMKQDGRQKDETGPKNPLTRNNEDELEGKNMLLLHMHERRIPLVERCSNE